VNVLAFVMFLTLSVYAETKIKILVSGGYSAKSEAEADKIINNLCLKHGGCDLALNLDAAVIPVTAKKLPSWVTFIDETSVRSRDICNRPGWKIMIGRRPIYSNGITEADKDERSKQLKFLNDCGIQFYVSGGDYHQEHISSETFESVIQAAFERLSDVDQVNYKPGDETRQNFARSENGYGILEATSEDFEIRFYDRDSKQIYRWRSEKKEVGLKSAMR
jgi:hypothetical protein